MSKLTQTKPALQRIKTAKTVSIYFWVLSFIAVTAKFAHYPFIKNDVPGICGYPWMSSFLYAIGGALSSLCLGLILLIIAPKTKHYAKAVKILGFLILYSSCYFMLMVLIDKEWALDTFGVKDLPVWAYRVSLFGLGIITGLIFITFNKAVQITEQKLRGHIKRLVEHLFNTKEAYLPLVVKAAKLEENSPPIDGHSWRDQINAIEVKDYEVLNLVLED